MFDSVDCMQLLAQEFTRNPQVMIAIGILGVAALVLGLGGLIRDLRRQETKRVDELLSEFLRRNVKGQGRKINQGDPGFADQEERHRRGRGIPAGRVQVSSY